MGVGVVGSGAVGHCVAGRVIDLSGSSPEVILAIPGPDFNVP